MNISLFVDDVRFPHEKGWHSVDTIGEAIRLLATQHVEEVSLDHDIHHSFRFDTLGGLEHVDRMTRMLPGAKDDKGKPVFKVACTEDYTPIAWYIMAMAPESRPKKIRIHSANKDGRLRLLAILQDSGVEIREAVLAHPWAG